MRKDSNIPTSHHEISTCLSQVKLYEITSPSLSANSRSLALRTGYRDDSREGNDAGRRQPPNWRQNKNTSLGLGVVPDCPPSSFPPIPRRPPRRGRRSLTLLLPGAETTGASDREQSDFWICIHEARIVPVPAVRLTPWGKNSVGTHIKAYSMGQR